MADEVAPKKPRIAEKPPPTEFKTMTDLFSFAEKLTNGKEGTLIFLDFSITIERCTLELKVLTVTNCEVHQKFLGEQRFEAFKKEFQQIMEHAIRPRVTFFKTDMYDPELIHQFLKDFGIESVRKVELAGHFGAATVNDFLSEIKTKELVLEPENRFDWSLLKRIQKRVETSKLASYANLDLDKFDNVLLRNTSFKSTDIKKLIKQWKDQKYPNFKNLNIVNNKTVLNSSTIMKGIIHTPLVYENAKVVHCTIVDAPQNGRISNLYINRNSFSFEVTEERDFYPEGYRPSK